MGANDDREMLGAAKAECVRLEQENAKLRGENRKLLIDGEPHRRQNRRLKHFIAESERLREQLAKAVGIAQEANDDCRKWAGLLAEAQATIEKVREWRDENQEHEVFEATDDEPEECTDECDWCVLDGILSAPSSTGGADKPDEHYSTGEHKRVTHDGGEVCDTCINILGLNIRWDQAPCRMGQRP